MRGSDPVLGLGTVPEQLAALLRAWACCVTGPESAPPRPQSGSRAPDVPKFLPCHQRDGLMLPGAAKEKGDSGELEDRVCWWEEAGKMP